MAKLLAHQILGLAVAYYVLRPGDLVQAFMYGGLALLGSVTPDLDGLRRHRATLHNIFALILAGLTIYLVLNTVEALNMAPVNLYSASSAIAYILAYLSHLLADIPTGSGVALLYPLSNRKIGILGLKYDNIVYNGLLVALATLLLYSFFTNAPTPYNIIRDWFNR